MIVTAIDFSPHDAHTLAAATALGHLLSEPLLLVHVLPSSGVSSPEADADRHGEAAQRLRAISEQLGPEVDVFPETLDGDVVTALRLLAERLEPRMLVIGGREGERYHGVEHAAAKLSRALSCPLLVAGKDGALEQRVSLAAPLRVLVPCDMSHNFDAARDMLGALRASAPVDCEIVTYYWPPAEERRQGLAVASVFAADPVVEAHLTADMRALVGELPGHGAVTFRAEPIIGTLGLAIAREARQRKFDLILAATHPQRAVCEKLTASVRQLLLAEATTPILLVPIGAPTVL